MKKGKIVLITIITILLVTVAGHIYYLTTFKGNELFANDTFLDKVENKTALIIVAHDDDAIGCSGTVSELTKKGWKISFVAFYNNFWRVEDNPIRKAEVAKIVRIQKLTDTQLINFNIAKSDTVKQPWMPIPYPLFHDYYNIDSLKFFIKTSIDKYKPSVIFSLDNITGLYGNPEHICVSQSIIDVCNEMKLYADFSVRKIYQSVYTRTQAEKIIGNLGTYLSAKKVYNCDGMPMPDVEVNISNSAKEKMETLLAYESQKRNLKKYVPYYNWYPYWIYFNIFNKEYFRTISINK